jgi:sensor histidine kinase YesM
VEYNGVRNRALLETVPFLAAAFVIMLTVIYFIVSRLTAGINSLVAGIGKIASGNLDAKIEEKYNDEFDLIKDAVNSMAVNLKTHIDGEMQAEREVYKAMSEKRAMEHELAQSKISTMISQIQPHFMYNTLAVIKHLCDTDPQTAKETIIEFSNYLRGNLDSLSQIELIPFDKELAHTETYLKIEKKRFDDMLNINYDIKVRDFCLPALTLQPIVENAVRYGVTKKEDGGTVTISTEETDNAFIIAVTDDGVGFDTQNQQTQNGRRHIGIENVRNRIFSMCGGTIDIQSKPGEGTKAVISIPKREVTENE